MQAGSNTDSILTITGGLVKKLPITGFSGGNSWSLTGNSGTSAGTNFLGTTDAQDLVFKANNTERLRIVNGVSTTTGTTGDITIGDATSGTLRSNKELVMRQDGDVYGPSTLRLRNRTGENGAIFETLGASASLVDFIFKTGTVATPIASNIRFETRNSSMQVTGNTTEWQIGQPAAATMVINAAATGNSALLIGNFGIGNSNPAEKLDVTGNVKFSGALMPNNLAGTAGDVLTSAGAGTSPVWASPSATSWSLLGNSGTNPVTNFLGTTDNKSLRFRTNNLQGFILDSLGSVGIGTSPTFTSGTYREKFLVDAGVTTSYNPMVVQGSIDSFFQFNIQNLSAGTHASSDIVATSNSGTQTSNYVDLGINGSNNSSNIFGNKNDAYLYNQGENFFIATSTPAKSLILMTGGTDSATNERMRISGAGNVGIGNAAPSQKLDVTGNIRFSGTLLPNNQAGNAGEFLISSGSGAAPTWFNATPFISTVAWVRAGNAGTTSATDFLGTTDFKSFKIKTNNTQRIIVDSLGSVGIGTSPTFTSGTYREKFLVDAGVTTSYNPMVVQGSIDSFFQFNIQNLSAGTHASSDIVATSNSGTQTSNYVDLGINGSNNSSNIFGNKNDAYLYNQGENFFIATSTPAKSLILMTGGTDSATNERMRIDGTGNVGISNPAPSEKLDVTGNVRFSGALMPNNLAGNAGNVLTSAGAGNVPIWTAPSATQWSITGNTGTAPGTNFLGTTDDNGLSFRTNNVQRMYIDSATGNVGIGTAAPAADFTLFQKSGTGPTKGLRFTGNSIAGNNSGTGFGMSLGYNVVNNKQLWLGDADYLGNSAATFFRLSSSTGYTIIDAVSGDNSSRRAIGIGVGGDASSGVILGNDGTSTSPSSYVWANGNMAIGNSYRAIAAPSNGLIVQGNAGIGATGFNATYPEKLLVDAGATGNTNYQNVIVGKGNTNSYAQLNIQNTNAGTNASSDVVATADNGNENTNYIDMGINSGSNTSNIMGVANDAYLYNQGQNLFIGTGTAAKSLIFTTGGTDSATNERMRITGTGNVGIGTAAPTARLQLKAGTATANTAPLKLTSGTNLTTPEAGAVEFDGTNYYATSGTTRYTLAKTLTNTAVLDFPSTAASDASLLTITVTGATDGDVVSIGVPNSANVGNAIYFGYVSAANTVTIRFMNNNSFASDPGSGTFRVSVLRY